MKINWNFLNKRHTPQDVYLGIFLKELEGIIFYISLQNGKLTTTETAKFLYTNGWENLAEDIDETLYKLETKTKASPDKTIFFIYSHLVDNLSKEIKKPYLQKIKDLVKNLELKPLGYIECHEALVEDFLDKEQIPLTATLIEVDKSVLSIFIYKAGKLVFKEEVSRTVDIIDDLLPVFAKIKEQTVLPTRIILYDSKNLDIESTNILTYRWSKDYFIQLPKVEIVNEERLFESLVKVFSNQVLPKTQAASEEKKPQEVMGFVIGADVTRGEPQYKKPQQESAPASIAKGKSFGFNPGVGLASLQQAWLNLKKTTTTITRALPHNFLPVAGVILIALALFLIEYNFHKAKITVFFPSQDIAKDLSVQAALKKEATGDDLIVASSADSADFTASQAATGTTFVGEKAKGQVQLLNYSGSEKTFDRGTVVSTGGIKFLLDDSVKVASASVASDLSLQPGKNAVGATAADIGPDSNLGKNQRLQVDDSPTTTYLAVGSSDFTGGSKKQVKVVSKDDANNLLKNVLDKARQYSDNEIISKLPQGFKLVKQLNDIKLVDQTFSNKVADAADNVSLKSKVEITYYSYKDNELIDKIVTFLKGDVKSGLKLSKERVKYTIKKATPETNKKYLLNINANVKATGDVNQDELLKTIVAKKTDEVQKAVKEKFHAAGLEFQIEDPIPFLKDWFPLFKKNIIIQISFI